MKNNISYVCYFSYLAVLKFDSWLYMSLFKEILEGEQGNCITEYTKEKFL